MSGGQHSFLETLEENLFSCLSFLLEASYTPWPIGKPKSSLHCQSQKWLVKSFPHYITLILTLLPPSLTFKNPCDYIGPTWITSLLSSQLINNLKSICNLNFSLLRQNIHRLCGLGSGPLWRVIILSTQTPKPFLFLFDHTPFSLLL